MTSLLTGGGLSRTLTIQADQRTVTDRPVPGLRVSPGFFSTLGARVIAGRDFDERDTRDVRSAPEQLFLPFAQTGSLRDASGEEFGEERLKDFLRGAVEASAEEISATLAARIREWMAGAEQHDDVTFFIAAVN